MGTLDTDEIEKSNMESQVDAEEAALEAAEQAAAEALREAEALERSAHEAHEALEAHEAKEAHVAEEAESAKEADKAEKTEAADRKDAVKQHEPKVKTKTKAKEDSKEGTKEKTKDKTQKLSKKTKIRILIVAALILVMLGTLFGVLLYRFYSNVRTKLTMETGNAAPTEDMFYFDPSHVGSVTTDLSQLDMSKVGEMEIDFSFLFFHTTSKLILIDTTAPKGETKDLFLPVGSKPEAKDFLASTEDVSGVVNVRYSYEPDFTIYGTQPVSIVLEDEGGNKSLCRAELTLYDESKKPEIKGLSNKSIYVGESIAYRAGVVVVDDLDEDPKLEIDSAAVNPDVPGVYDVVYTATDYLGRSSSVSVKLHVEEKPENMVSVETLHTLADEKLKEILTDDMTEIEKAFAIFRWSRMGVPWVRTGSHDSEVDQAIAGLQGNSGDCYTHAVVCKVLLERAGFIIDFIEKKNETGTHYWVMVNIDGNWYHMDPSPIYIKQYCAFLSTTEDLMKYAQKYRPHLYDYIIEDHPESATVSPASAEFKDNDYYLSIGGVPVDQAKFGPPVTDNPPNAAHPEQQPAAGQQQGAAQQQGTGQ